MGASSGQNSRGSFVTMQNKARPATHTSSADVLAVLTSEGSVSSSFLSTQSAFFFSFSKLESVFFCYSHPQE